MDDGNISIYFRPVGSQKSADSSLGLRSWKRIFVGTELDCPSECRFQLHVYAAVFSRCLASITLKCCLRIALRWEPKIARDRHLADPENASLCMM